MKKIFSFVAASLFAATMMAETAKVNPTWEACYRTNNVEPTGWNSGFPKFNDEQFEVKNKDARIFVIQTWTIANISTVDSLDFVYERVSGQTNKGDLAMWLFPYNSAPTTSAYSSDFIENVKNVLGVYPGGEIDENHAPFKVSVVREADGKLYRAVALSKAEIVTLAAAGKVENDYLTVNVLLTTYTASQNFKYYHTGDAASYCTVVYAGEISVPAIINNTTKAGYTNLATAVEEATAGDALILNEDVTISDARLTITKDLTIQGATGAEKIICGVSANTLMVLANGNDANYTVTFKNITVDGQNTERATQLFDANNKGQFCFDGVSVINTTYSVVTGDVKNNGNAVLLKGLNSFPTGIYLNKNKRVDGKDATHTAENPVKLILSGDYAEDYVVVLNCADSALYTAVDAADVTGWELYKSDSKAELKCRKVEKQPTALNQIVDESKAVKRIINGQIVIIRDNKMFDLTGAQL